MCSACHSAVLEESRMDKIKKNIIEVQEIEELKRTWKKFQPEFLGRWRVKNKPMYERALEAFKQRKEELDD